jgi:hypothetical protein
MDDGEEPVETVTRTLRWEWPGRLYSWIGLAQEVFEASFKWKKKPKTLSEKEHPRKTQRGDDDLWQSIPGWHFKKRVLLN